MTSRTAPRRAPLGPRVQAWLGRIAQPFGRAAINAALLAIAFFALLPWAIQPMIATPPADAIEASTLRETLGPAHPAKIEEGPEGLVVTLHQSVGRYGLRPGARDALERLAPALSAHPGRISVTAHVPRQPSPRPDALAVAAEIRRILARHTDAPIETAGHIVRADPDARGWIEVRLLP